MLRCLVLFVCVARVFAGTCTLLYNANHPGVFFRMIGSNSILQPIANGRVTWDKSQNLMAFCSSGFRGYSSMESQPEKEIIFKCSGTSMQYRKPDSTAFITARNNGLLSCSDVSLYHEAKTKTCPKYTLAYGFFVGKKPVIFAEICFNLSTMRPRYIHYVAGVRSLVLDNQDDFNPRKVSMKKNSSIELLFDKHYVENEQDALTNALLQSIPNYAGIVFYDIDGLVPLKTSAGIFSPYVKDFREVNIVPWWRPLKHGNWKEVEKAIAMAASANSFEIYAGTSGVVTYPVTGNFLQTERLTYTANQHVRDVPLLIWNYVWPKYKKNDGFVIIGVNSPFFEIDHNKELFCADMCDTIDWMEGINRIRKIPALGYVFCCHLNETIGILENLPLL